MWDAAQWGGDARVGASDRGGVGGAGWGGVGRGGVR